MSVSIECPACNVPIKMNAHTKLGQTITCNACKTNLEVVWLDPVELDILFDNEDDDNDDGFYDDASEDPYEDYEYADDTDYYDRD